MATVNLGGLKVSSLGFGCMGITAFYGAPMEDAAALKLLKGAYDAGYTHFDTAEIYNTDPYNAKPNEPKKFNEEIVGKFVKTVKRDTVTVATKFNPALHKMEVDEATVTKSFNDSLARLGLDYVDLYYCHRMPGSIEKMKQWMASAATLVKAGKVKYLGLSEVSGAWLREAHKIHPVAAVQQEWSLITRQPIEDDIVPVCAELNIGIVAYSPLARNLLTEQKELPKDWRSTNPRFAGENFDKNKKVIAEISALGEEQKVSTAQLSLAWLYHKAASYKVSMIAIPGTTKLDNAIANIDSLQVKLTDEQIASLEALAKNVVGARGNEMYLASSAEAQVAPKLYYTPTSCGVASYIALTMGEVPFTSEVVNLQTGLTATGKVYESINWSGSVPALVFADGLVLSQNVSTLLWAHTNASKPWGPTANSRDYFEMVDNLSYVNNTIHRYIGQGFGAKDAEAKAKCGKEAETALSFMFNKQLDGGKKKFLGSVFSVADIYAWVCLSWTVYLGIPMEEGVKTYFDTVGRVPGVGDVYGKLNAK